ncbi:MAG: hypothetical protein WC683_02165 [bacterium]
MATRYIGDAKIRVEYLGRSKYSGTVEVGGIKIGFEDQAPKSWEDEYGTVVDTREPMAYDQIAAMAVGSIVSFSTAAREAGEERPPWGPSTADADAIEKATRKARGGKFGYDVERSRPAAVRRSAKGVALPEEVRRFVEAVFDNAAKSWSADDNMSKKKWLSDPANQRFVTELLHITVDDEGVFEIADNFERFFDTIFIYSPDGSWSYRRMFSEDDPKPYSFAQAMHDASIMYTG